MTAFLYHQYNYGFDNYGVLIHDPKSLKTACVDVGDSEKALSELKNKNWTLDEIWITHHHGDHTDGLLDLKQKTGAFVYGPRQKSQIIRGLDKELSDGDEFIFSNQTVRVIHTPGHTIDMVNFYLPDQNTLFSGDTLFALGCGRIFEGNAAMMWESLKKLIILPEETIIYCSHEYTLANAEFSISIDPKNKALQERVKAIKDLRNMDLPTIPTNMGLELKTNPFLRASDPKIRQQLDMVKEPDTKVFEKVRLLKDNF